MMMSGQAASLVPRINRNTPRGEALFPCARPSGVPRGPAIQHSFLRSPVTLASPDSQLCLLKSGRQLSSLSLHCSLEPRLVLGTIYRW